MEKPLISILICCHNRRDYLKLTLESVLAQNYKPVEIIIVDDGSTDDTEGMLEAYKDKITYFKQEQQGIAAARNKACELSKGAYIAFQDDDDLMPPDRIVHEYDALQKYPQAIFATGYYELIDEDGVSTGKTCQRPANLAEGEVVLYEDGYKAVLWPEVPVSPHTSLFKREYGEKINWHDINFRFSASDKDFYARLGALGSIVYLNEIVSYYRRGHSSIWGKNQLKAVTGTLQLWIKHLGNLGHDRMYLRQRFEDRLLNTLKLANELRAEGKNVSVELPGMYAEAVKLLSMQRKLSLIIYAVILVPLKTFKRKYLS